MSIEDLKEEQEYARESQNVVSSNCRSSDELRSSRAVDMSNYQSSGGLKATVLYGHPKNPEEFEKYYLETHMPLVVAANPGKRMETSKCPPAADGSPAPYYRIFEIWFDSQAEMAAITSTPEWKKVVADVPNFATGGITRVLSRLD